MGGIGTVGDDVLGRIVKAYDIRGLVGDELTPAVTEALGGAAAEVIGVPGTPFVLGRDMRPSSPDLLDAFARGVVSRGFDVVDVGLASTDLVYYASGMLAAPGAMFTASHNPARYNGIKLCGPGAGPVAIDSGLAEIRDRARGGPLAGPGPTGSHTSRDMTGEFAAHVRSFVAPEALEGLRIAVDAGNGMAGYTWPRIADPLGVSTTALYFELDGTFPNHPADPLDARNLRDLQEAVVAGGCVLGLAFDGDGDRVFAVDERGDAVSASVTGAVIIDRLLRREPGATVLHNLICSRTVPDTVHAAGGRAVRTRVGHSFVKQKMAATGALAAVEHSGHYYFRDNFGADSGAVAALILLEAVAEDGRPMSEILAPYDRYVASGERNFRVGDAGGALEEVAAAFAERGSTDDEDGLTVELPEGWFNLRESNTEPLLRLNVEATDAGSLSILIDEVVRVLRARGAVEEGVS